MPVFSCLTRVLCMLCCAVLQGVLQTAGDIEFRVEEQDGEEMVSWVCGACAWGGVECLLVVLL